MISMPADWPLWPYLPLRHVSQRDADGLPKLGFLVDSNSFTVYVGCVGCAAEVIRSGEKEEHETAQEVIAAGWRVD
jgi:hypothetical protein